MSKVYLGGFTGEDPVSCWAVFSRQSDGKVLIAVTDSVSRLYRSLSNANRGDRLSVYCSVETAGGADYDQCERGAFKVAKLLKLTLPDADDGWLAITGAEAVGYLEAAASVKGVALEPMLFSP
jgi:hypothetical protein